MKIKNKIKKLINKLAIEIVENKKLKEWNNNEINIFKMKGNK